MAKSRYSLPAGQIMTVTPANSTSVQVYRNGGPAGDFLSVPVSYGPFAAPREYVVDGPASVAIADADPSSLRGTFVCNGSTAVTIANANIQRTDVVIISLNTIGGTVGAIPRLDTITPGTGFTTKGTASDTSTYNYAIVRNAI